MMHTNDEIPDAAPAATPPPEPPRAPTRLERQRQAIAEARRQAAEASDRAGTLRGATNGATNAIRGAELRLRDASPDQAREIGAEVARLKGERDALLRAAEEATAAARRAREHLDHQEATLETMARRAWLIREGALPEMQRTVASQARLAADEAHRLRLVEEQLAGLRAELEALAGDEQPRPEGLVMERPQLAEEAGKFLRAIGAG